MKVTIVELERFSLQSNANILLWENKRAAWAQRIVNREDMECKIRYGFYWKKKTFEVDVASLNYSELIHQQTLLKTTENMILTKNKFLWLQYRWEEGPYSSARPNTNKRTVSRNTDLVKPKRWNKRFHCIWLWKFLRGNVCQKKWHQSFYENILSSEYSSPHFKKSQIMSTYLPIESGHEWTMLDEMHPSFYARLISFVWIFTWLQFAATLVKYIKHKNLKEPKYKLYDPEKRNAWGSKSKLSFDVNTRDL